MVTNCLGAAGLVYRLPTLSRTSLKSFVRHKTLIHSINEREVSLGHLLCTECVCLSVSIYGIGFTNEYILITTVGISNDDLTSVSNNFRSLALSGD